MEIGNFHNRDGWYFKRLEDGSVRIQKTTTAHVDAPVEYEHVIPENEWASIVAHVSVGGETGDSYQEAREFHAGRRFILDARAHQRLCRDTQEFARIAAAVYPDESMLVRFRGGRVPAQSFEMLHRYAKRVESPNSAFDVED
jgi:hypothetical protein